MKGKEFEDMACDWLISKGYTILRRNYRCRTGEIDIIAKKEDKYIAFEVKGNKTYSFGLPEERINNIKIKRIKNCLFEYAMGQSVPFENLQIDAIFIYQNKITHLENLDVI